MIYFLIAAFNEKENIPKLLADIDRVFPGDSAKRVIIVDDGSTDGTAQEAKRAMPSAEILIHDKNQGLGNALKTGFTRIFSIIKPEDSLITLDADNTHPIEIAVEMINKLKSADIVIASRYVPGAEEIGLSKIRKLLSLIAGRIFSLLFPAPGLRDYTSGYRAFRADFLLKIKEKYGQFFITESGFTATAEILFKSLRLKPRITEVPLVLRYDLKKGKSKMKVLRTIVSYFFLTFRQKFDS